MAEASKEAEIDVYPGADHGFTQPLYADGANLDPEATRMTWLLLEDFPGRHLPMG
jgi:dienelactone hydrolase